MHQILKADPTGAEGTLCRKDKYCLSRFLPYAIIARVMAAFRKLLVWLPALFWAGLAFYLSAQSQLPDIGPQFNVGDKVMHFIFYLIFWFLVLLPLRYGHRLSLAKAIVLAFLITSSYGASDEFHQSFVPNRSCDVTDWIADTFGGFIAASAYWVYETRRSSKTNR